MFICGELIQELCDVYCGLQEDFNYNPRIQMQSHKHKDFHTIQEPWNNPRVIFCYTHRLEQFAHILHYIQNEFVLITHNSDTNITSDFQDIIEHPKLLFWHAQNVVWNHPKLGSLPIGIANSMWPHGNTKLLTNVLEKCPVEKPNAIYFNFSIHTNFKQRSHCYDILKGKGLSWQMNKEFKPYLETLSTYKYAICPPGNGIDCHRIWECFYLGVIPIVLRSVYTENLQEAFPCYLLDSWEDLSIEQALNSYVKPDYDLSFNRIKNCIETNRDFLSPKHTLIINTY